jgi:hypothetical protein
MAISIVVSGSAGSTTITSSTLSVANVSNVAASAMAVSISGLTATNLEAALLELAGNDFRQDTAPTGSQVTEGDTWYDTNDNQLKIYRETSVGTFGWVPIMIGNSSTDSDTLDAGAF